MLNNCITSRKRKTKKKGSIFDQFLFIMLALIFLIIIIIGGFLYVKVSEGLREATESTRGTELYDNLNSSLETLENNAEKYPAFWDLLFAGILFGIWIILFASSWILGSSSAFLIVFVLLSFGSTMFGIVMKVTMSNLKELTELAWFFNDFPITCWLIDNYIIVTLLFIASIGIALYSKRTGSDQLQV